MFDRPDEIRELLQSMTGFTSDLPFEVVIVEDGSTNDAKEVVGHFKQQLNISYFYKENSGPGDSRNYGMRHAKGNYFIILDSDVIMPPNYLEVVYKALKEHYLDCFGGADAAHESFSDLQKAINYSMTSLLTTGGIRGSKSAVQEFEPRSFNMGIAKKVFEATGGFGKIHPGEDPDLSWRIKKAGFTTGFIPGAAVFHKRRISWAKFRKQVTKFGLVRPILNKWHPESKKITFWFPTLFIAGVDIAIILLFFNINWPMALVGVYLGLIFLDSSIKNKSFSIGAMSVVATLVQFYSYGIAFFRSSWLIGMQGKDPKKVFPHLFFE